MFLTVRRLVERSARWLVHHGDGLALGPTIDEFRPGVRAVASPDLLAATGAAHRAAPRPNGLRTLGVPEDLARRVAGSEAALVRSRPPSWRLVSVSIRWWWRGCSSS